MPITRRCLPYAIACLAALALSSASAAGLGAAPASAVLGQPLDFAVQLRLDAGEAIDAACVGAEVTVGDRRMAASLVHTRLEMTGANSARVRVLTTQAISEPVAGVLVDVHCPTVRLSRRFVVFADPPLFRIAAPAAAYAPAFAANLSEVPAPPPGASSPAPAPAAELMAATGAATVAPGAVADGAAPATRAERSAPGVRTESPRRAGTRPAQAEAAPGAAAARPHRRAAAPGAQRSRRARAAPPPASAAAAAPRLRLEAVAPVPSAQTVAIDEALEAVAQAASAARVAASAAAADAARIASLERTVEALRADVASNRDAAALLRERLAQADQAGRWTWPLLALVLVVTSLAAWLAWRLNSAQAERQLAWQRASRAPPAAPESELTPSKLPTAPIPFVTSEIMLPARAGAPASARPAWPAPAPPDTVAPPADARPAPAAAKPAAPDAAPAFEYDDALHRTEPLPAQGALGDAAPRDVTIEELIDLEQQAEFFVVLGQDEAAIELLVEHLRQTGGGSPLPYLKLLEIYRRRGDRSDYERLRTRFNQRFNAYAPGWDADLQGGRALESYPGVVPRLQQVWSRPLDAMAELEALLFRKSRGDLFELPAYRDVLLLYSLARDLMDREGADTGSVDLLLPLADGGEFSSTSPAPFMVSQRDGAPGHDAQASATAPVDFDISSQASGPSSIFGPLDDGAKRVRSR